jgi:hypothetical protein
MTVITGILPLKLILIMMVRDNDCQPFTPDVNNDKDGPWQKLAAIYPNVNKDYDWPWQKLTAIFP